MALDYNDISLVSNQISSIHSRNDIDISVEFCGVTLTNPIIASPMKDVCDGKIAKIMAENGGLGIIHRFCSLREQGKEFFVCDGLPCGCAIGLDDKKRFNYLYNIGCRIFCIDVANGASERVYNEFALYKKTYYDCSFVLGNVCSRVGYRYLAKSDAVRVGVAGGSVCSTKTCTGIYNPAISLIDSCSYNKNKKDAAIIADGGIKTPGDFCKALIFGADCVMLGGVIAASEDSPAEVVEQDGRKYKLLHGSASKKIQMIYKDSPKYIEGEKALLPIRESLPNILQRFNDGLRSSMSYFNATNLDKYRQNLDWIKV